MAGTDRDSDIGIRGQEPPLSLDANRIRHISAVSERAVRVGRLMGIRDEGTLRRLFALGWLHDLGYALARPGEGHEDAGGRFLRSMGYADWREVAEHGNPDPGYASVLLEVLNAADMLTDSRGNAVTFSERLADIAERYGEDSPVTQRAAKVIESLRERGYGVAEEDVLRERNPSTGDAADMEN